MSDNPFEEDFEAAHVQTKREPQPVDPLLLELRDTIHTIVNKLLHRADPPQPSLRHRCIRLRKKLDAVIAEQKAAYEADLG